MDLQGIAEQTGSVFASFVRSPPCPKFPGLSMFLGEWASSFYNLLHWFGAPMGPFGGLLFALSMRRHKVEWARTPIEERMNMMLLGAVALPARVLAAMEEVA